MLIHSILKLESISQARRPLSTEILQEGVLSHGGCGCCSGRLLWTWRECTEATGKESTVQRSATKPQAATSMDSIAVYGRPQRHPQLLKDGALGRWATASHRSDVAILSESKQCFDLETPRYDQKSFFTRSFCKKMPSGGSKALLAATGCQRTLKGHGSGPQGSRHMRGRSQSPSAGES